MTEKNQDLGVCAQRNPKAWVSLPRDGPSLGSLCADYNQDLVTSWQARRKTWDFSWQKGSKLDIFWTGLEWCIFLGSWALLLTV